MQAKEYQKLAAVTESPVTPELKARVKSVHASMLGAMSLHLGSSNSVDVLKRNVYYGKRPTNSKDLAILEEMESRSKQVELLTDLPKINDWYVRFFHAMLGLHTEVGELWEALDKLSELPPHVDDSGIKTNIKEELGDLCWYIALVCNAMEIGFEDVLESNIRKLNEKRYKGKGFTEDSAVNRDLAAEAEALKGG